MQNCIVCGGSDILGLSARYSRHGDALCKGCGLVFRAETNPDDIRRYYYDSGYHTRSANRGARRALVSRSMLVHGAARRVEHLEALGIQFRQGQRVLDIGCGYASVLAWLRDHRGCQVTGLEPSASACAATREFFGLDLQQCTLEDFKAEQPFDVVLSIHSLEHAVRPDDFLRRCREMLKPEGRLYVECPNFLHPTGGFSFPRFLEKDHLFHFSSVALAALCGKAGLEVLRKEDRTFLRLVLKRLDQPAPADPETLKLNSALVQRFLRSYPLQRQLQLQPLRIFVRNCWYVATVASFKARDALTRRQ